MLFKKTDCNGWCNIYKVHTCQNQALRCPQLQAFGSLLADFPLCFFDILKMIVSGCSDQAPIQHLIFI